MAIPLPLAPTLSMKYSAAVTLATGRDVADGAGQRQLTLPLVGFGLSASRLVAGPWSPARFPRR